MDQLKYRFLVARWIAEELAGIIGEEDRCLLEAWRKEKESNELEYQDLRKEYSQKAWDCYSEKEIARQWSKFRKNKRFLSRRLNLWYRYAACILLLLGIGGGWMWHWKLEKENRLMVTTDKTISMATGSPLLILSNGETFTLNDTVFFACATTLKQALDSVECRTQSEIVEDEYNTLIIPQGGGFQIQLADGTLVWLNSETELHYPLHFAGTERRVFLKGEAYFEVAKNAEKPFIVSVGGIEVRVLGTKFNITAYEDEEQITTTLAEGSVEVGNRNGTVKLSPDEQASFQKKDSTFQVQKVDASAVLAWKDGKFIFEEQSLEQIMKRLQRWYKMDVFYANEEVKHYLFSGDLKKYDDFDEIVQMIEEVAGIEISIKGDCVVIGTK